MTETDRLESLELKCMDLENTVNALNELTATLSASAVPAHPIK